MQPGSDTPGTSGSPGEPRRQEPSAPASRLDEAANEEHGRTLLERLRRIAQHGPGRERYRVLEEIGRGGMGRVLRVWDEDLQRELALKELTFDAGSGTEEERAHRELLLSRFISEARISSQLDHPGIVPVHEIAIDRHGRLYFTMPLIRGRTVQEIFDLARAGKRNWTLHRALEALLRVTHTVAYAHSKGVIHRDIKPSNVMVGLYHEVYVMDWGLALVRGQEERDAVVGTPAYMAPEQAAGDASRVDERSDVYSIGAMIYELLTGLMPHETTLAQGSVEGGVGALALRAPRSVSELDEDLPPELVAICEKAMSARPKDRYQSAMALADDLQAWLERRVVGAYETGRWARLKKWRERNPGLSMALEALLLLALVSVAIVTWVQRSKLTAIAREHDRSERHGHAARLKAAELSFTHGGSGDAHDFLEASPTDLRGWAWRHLRFRADSSVHRLEEHEATVTAVAMRADGTRLATASADGTVGLWDPRDGSLVGRITGHTRGVTATAFAPDETLLASGSEDYSVRLWDATTGAFSRELGRHASQVTALAFAPSGDRVVSGDERGELRVWSLEAGPEHVVRFPDRPIRRTMGLAWVDEQHVLAAYSDGGVARVRVDGGLTVDVTRLESSVYSLALDADRTVAAVASLSDGVLLLDAMNLNRVLRRIDLGESSPRSVAFGPDDELYVGTTEGAIHCFDGAGEAAAVFHGHTSPILSIALHPAGSLFASGSSDWTARVWDRRVDDVRSFRVAMDLTAPPPRLEITTYTLAAGVVGGIGHHGILGDDPTVTLATRAPCTALALHDDGGTLAVGYGDGTIELLDRESGGRLGAAMSGSDVEVRSLALDPSGTRLLSRGLDATLRLWDVEEGRALLELPDPLRADAGYHEGLAFDPAGERFAFGTQDGDVRVHDARDGELLLDLAGESTATRLVFSADGDTLLAGCSNGTVTVWDLAAGRARLSLHGHRRRITGICLLDGAERIATASADRTVRIWDAELGDLLITLRCLGPVADLAHDAKKDRLLAVERNGRVTVWRTQAGD